jgi:predicted nucleic acid-binding protein
LIAADTSSIVAYLSGEVGQDVELVESALIGGELLLPPPVVSELWSKPERALLEPLLDGTPVIEIADGFWRRAGDSRRVLLAQGLKAAMANALVAQCCIDADVALIARDRDYRHFERWCGLKLAG